MITLSGKIKGILKKTIKILLAIVLIVLLFRYIDIKEFLAKLKEVNSLLILVVFLLYVPSVFISSLKWHLILKGVYGLDLRFLYLVKIYFIGGFYNNFLPSTIGGDGYKFYVLNKNIKNQRKEIFSSIFLERGIGFLMLFIINFIITAFFYHTIVTIKSLALIELILLSIFFGFLITMCFRKPLMAKGGMLRKIPFTKKVFNLLMLHQYLYYLSL